MNPQSSVLGLQTVTTEADPATVSLIVLVGCLFSVVLNGLVGLSGLFCLFSVVFRCLGWWLVVSSSWTSELTCYLTAQRFVDKSDWFLFGVPGWIV